MIVFRAMVARNYPLALLLVFLLSDFRELASFREMGATSAYTYSFVASSNIYLYIYFIYPTIALASFFMGRRWLSPLFRLRAGNTLRWLVLVVRSLGGFFVALFTVRVASLLACASILDFSTFAWDSQGAGFDLVVTVLNDIESPIVAIFLQWVLMVVTSLLLSSLFVLLNHVSKSLTVGSVLGIWLLMVIGFRRAMFTPLADPVAAIFVSRALSVWAALLWVPWVLLVGVLLVGCWILDHQRVVKRLLKSPLSIWGVSCVLCVVIFLNSRETSSFYDAVEQIFYVRDSSSIVLISFLLGSLLFLGPCVSLAVAWEDHISDFLYPTLLRFEAPWKWAWRVLRPGLLVASLSPVAMLLLSILVLILHRPRLPLGESSLGHVPWLTLFHLAVNGGLQVVFYVLVVFVARWVGGSTSGALLAIILLLAGGTSLVFGNGFPSLLGSLGLVSDWNSSFLISVELICCICLALVSAILALYHRPTLERNLR